MRTSLVAKFVLVSCIGLFSHQPAFAAGSAQQQAREAAFDAHFGLYVGGKKVGWLHSYLKGDPRIEMGFSLHATVGSMGQQANITMEEIRHFSTAAGQLEDLHFEQRAPTGSVVVNGRRRGKAFAMSICAGGAQRRHEAALEETLNDNLAAWSLAGAGKAPKPVGSVVTVNHLDATSGQNLAAQVRVEKIEPRMVGGLPSQLTTVTTEYTTLAVREVSVFDGQANVLRTQVGGYFEARREEEKVAKADVAPGDLLLDAVVKAPKPLENVEQAGKLELTLTGLGSLQLLASTRQQVVRTPDDVRLRLLRDEPVPATLRLSTAKRSGKQSADPEVVAARKATDFIQSDAPALQTFARQCTMGKTTAAQSIEALMGCVRGRLHSEYVPAFSNALEAFHSRRGDCTEHSVLFVALLRAIGLPARVAVGFAYWPPGDGFGWHAWAEVFVDGRWVSVDPTWGQAIADVSHVKIADGDPLSQMRVVMVLGQVKVARAQLLP